MKNLTLTLLFVSISSVLMAKKDFDPGTLILRNGDTLSCDINLGNFENKQVITIMLDKKKVKYRPAEIKSVEVGGMKYVSVPVKLFSISDEIRSDGHVLVEAVEEGVISLYKLSYCHDYSISKDRRAKGSMTECKSIFYLLSDIKPYYFEVYSTSNTVSAMSLINKNKQKHSLNELAGYFEACPEVSKDILYERIKRVNIYDAVEQYNKCIEASTKAE